MNKENILFGTIGLLLGLIVGFMFANSVNRSSAPQIGSQLNQTANVPEGHPEVTGNNPTQAQMANAPEVQAAIEQAKKEPDNFEAQLKAAEFYYQIQQYDGAIEFLKQANKLQPENYEVIVHLGNANFDSSKFEEAEKWYLAALGKKANDVNVRTDLGLTFIFRDPPNYDRAIQEFTKSLETDPNHTQTIQNLIVAYTRKGDAENANATLAKLESLDSTNTAIPKLREDIQKIK
jgi:tetratricopeptide (TPR) repeat protein